MIISDCRDNQLKKVTILDIIYQPTVSQVLDFLHSLYELGLSSSATGASRSAVSAMVKIPGGPKLREHWLVSRFMKGIFYLRPPQPSNIKTWDVDKVLSYQFEVTDIENHSFVDNLSLEDEFMHYVSSVLSTWTNLKIKLHFISLG